MNRRPKVYLAGPVLGNTFEEASGWRQKAARALSFHGLHGISPVRAETPNGDVYDFGTKVPGGSHAIGSKNLFDVQSADAILAYFPLYDCHTPYAAFVSPATSKGTLIELAWARAFNKATILVTEDTRISDHPVVRFCAGWSVKTLEEGVTICTELLGAYA